MEILPQAQKFTICFEQNLILRQNSTDSIFQDEKQASLSQWFSRLLHRHSWTVRKTTVSQKVPSNWIEVAQLDSARICETMRAAGVEVLINADQTFLRFYPEDDHVLAPVGSKRVGSTIKTDEKKGCTLMGGMEMFTSSCLPGFIVLTGTYQGRLGKSWAEYQGESFVAFQPKHWFDKNIMKDWLD